MKKRILCIILATVLFVSGAAVATAAGVYKNITAQLRSDITITVDGAKQSLSSYPIVYNGTTYLPLRSVGNILGLSVNWNGATKTVAIGDSGSNMTATEVTLSAGRYVVGTDIAPGKYNVTAVSGSGNFIGQVSSLGFMGLNEIMTANGNDILSGFGSRTYSNLKLVSGDYFTISSGLTLRFPPIK